MQYTPESKVLIVGAGCFGISTGYHLLKRGFKDVTIIDRSQVLPAPDAASTDLNKIVRSSYADVFYTELARDAIKSWKNEEEWGTNYHESGVIVFGSEDHTYTTTSYTNDVSVGCRLSKLGDSNQNAFLPSDVNLGPSAYHRSLSYLNHDGGWVHSAGGVVRGMKNIIALGGKIIPGKQVKKLIREDGKTAAAAAAATTTITRGVECMDGSTFTADVVVIATGSWTPSAFAELDLEGKCTATGQSVAMIQLTPEEASRYRDVPIILDQETGFYMFPPNSDNIMKLAIHSTGYTRKSASPANDISTPRTSLSHGDQEGSRIPKSKVRELRECLYGYYPELAETKPFVKTRLCWYLDTPDENWVIGFHPTDRYLVFATGGSGHAYKFLPVIGRLVADAIQGTLPDDLVNKFAVDRSSHATTTVVETRRERVPELDEDQLCVPEDLLPGQESKSISN